jgi:hypothetical protein
MNFLIESIPKQRFTTTGFELITKERLGLKFLMK